MSGNRPRRRTPFHKAFRAIQLDYGIRLASVARSFGLGAPALYRLISGRGPIPPWLVPRLAEGFGLSAADRLFLEQAAAAMAGADGPDAELAAAFARGLRDLGEEDVEKIGRRLAAASEGSERPQGA